MDVSGQYVGLCMKCNYIGTMSNMLEYLGLVGYRV